MAESKSIDGRAGARAARPEEGRATALARRGLHTDGDYVDFGGAMIHDILTGAVDNKAAHATARMTNTTIRAAELVIRNGGTGNVPMAGRERPSEADAQREALAQKRRALEAELEALAEQQAALSNGA